MQFIVCGLLLAAALVINLIDSPLADEISSVVKNAIQEQTTVEDVKSAVDTAKTSVKTIFGGVLNDSENAENADGLASQAGSPEASGDAEPGDFRIDEDILSKIAAVSGDY
jgi:hypothetical protein